MQTEPPRASTVPVLQMAFSSSSLSEQQVLDLSQNFARPRLTTVYGAAVPFSYGGKYRSIQIDLDPAAIRVFRAKGHQGVNYATGVWHHYLLPLEDESDFLVIDRAGPGENLDEIELAPADQITVKL